MNLGVSNSVFGRYSLSDDRSREGILGSSHNFVWHPSRSARLYNITKDTKTIQHALHHRNRFWASHSTHQYHPDQPSQAYQRLGKAQSRRHGDLFGKPNEYLSRREGNLQRMPRFTLERFHLQDCCKLFQYLHEQGSSVEIAWYTLYICCLLLVVVGLLWAMASGFENSRGVITATGPILASALRINHPTIWIKYSTVSPQANSYRKM